MNTGYTPDHRLEPTVDFDYDALDRRTLDETAHEIQLLVCEKITQFAAEIASHDRPALSLDAFLLAFGLTGQSETDLARKHGVSRAALSKRAVEITRSLGINPSRGMKSAASRRVYAERTKQYHAKRSHDRTQSRRRLLKRVVEAIRRHTRATPKGKRGVC